MGGFETRPDRPAHDRMRLPKRTRANLKGFVFDPEGFSSQGLHSPLRRYQLQPARAIFETVMRAQGGTFVVEMARQAGKNELQARLEAQLLFVFQNAGGQIVKASPTFKPQTINSLMRLHAILDRGRVPYTDEHGYITRVGNARALFFSAQPTANVVGATASLLLEADEAQDIDPTKWTREFAPMAASTNAPRVFWGTAWSETDLLQETLAASPPDHQFVYPWDIVADEIPEYGAFVQDQIAALGIDHPIIRTQYRLLPLGSAGRALTALQLAALQGDQPRRYARGDVGAPSVVVAGLDLAGQSLPPSGDSDGLPGVSSTPPIPAGQVSTHSPLPLGEGPGVRDAVALTIGAVDFVDIAGARFPRVRVLDRAAWIGVPHPALFATLADLLDRLWAVDLVTIDATGVGAGVAAFLEQALGAHRVERVTFDGAWSLHSDLAYTWLAAVNSGRFLEYAVDGDDLTAEAWKQYRLARMDLKPGQRIKLHIQEREGHDDLLMSAMLCCRAARGVGAPAAAAAVAHPDPLSAIDREGF